MYPLMEIAIAPVLEAVSAQRIVEIGALRGETTVRLLDRLGPDAEVHVVDPVPEFDPTEHEQRFPGRYVFYRDISHNVLPTLPPMDVALVDGDHNWYTVFHELAMLDATARAEGRDLPVLIMHDVLWPYGRRDLYYAPERIPDEFRHPHAQRGIQPGRTELLPEGRGGLNPTLNNALYEGGQRNGVMTALDDFVEQYDRPLRRVVLPIYFGLAIVAEEERLARQPALAAVLDHLESADGRKALLERGESLRTSALVFQHRVFYGSQARIGRAVQRYLDLLRGALLDEHYLENEARIGYLTECIDRGRQPDPEDLHDPARRLRPRLEQLRNARRTGSFGHDTPGAFPFTSMGRHRMDHLERCLDTIRQEAVAGDLAACGVGRGGAAIFMRGFLAAHEAADTRVWVADPFRGLGSTRSPESDDAADHPVERSPDLMADLNIVRDGFARFDLLDERVRFLQGAYADTLPTAPIECLALLLVDTGTYESTRHVLDQLYDKVALGGFVVVNDYSVPAVQKAVDEFRSIRAVGDLLELTDWSGASWRVTGQAARAPLAAVPTTGGRAPLAPPLPSDRVALSVIVVVYNMRREAARTLHSLSRAYQQSVDDLDYEVIVVENGSDESERLGEDLVRGYGPEFHYLDLADEALPSPAHAVNRGIALARGETIAIMVDGAHVLTPGVLRFGTLATRDYDPAVVLTQQWYVGPGQQPDATQNGYDQQYEDRLFEEIQWPVDGYRLFDIGHFIGERDWFDGMWESNCVFVPRHLLEQTGGMDESFAMPGGGFVNLDFYERLTTTPGVTVASILGEGSFHQTHGGTTTNTKRSDDRENLLATYREHYTELRGRRFAGPNKPVYFVGSMPAAARRTRARRLGAPAFFKRAQRLRADGRPEQPIPIPEELSVEFVDAFWRSFAWRDTRWLGTRLGKCPTDVLIYQDLITSVRPDWVVETGVGAGGRAFFLASICELLGHGRVLSIDDRTPRRPPQHDRITVLEADPLAESTTHSVREVVGAEPNALVVLGLARREHIVRQFDAYAPLVPVGSYVVVEDTIVNGHPVWPGMGPGPAEAIKAILRTRSDFVVDSSVERFGLTFNPGGYLKRVT